MRLFSYCIPIDDGAAPNPYWDKCTLAICKPVIRRVAKVGDWVIGVGSKNVNGIDYSGKLVYAMKVTQKMTLSEYDRYCKKCLQNKIPNVKHKKYERRLGDCIYDFELHPEGKLLPSVHSINNKPTDIGGVNALLSNHFYYFGDNAICIPQNLKGVIKQGQGHKSNANDYLKQEFVLWLESQNYVLNKLYGKPQYKVEFKYDLKEETYCALVRCKSNEADELIEHQN